MAEIKIEKKKPIWPWILLIIILLAVVAYFIYVNNESDDFSDDMDTEEVDDMDDMNDNTLNDSVTYQDAMDFPDSTDVIIQYNESIKDSMRIGTDSTYTKTALYNLSKAVLAIASQNNVESSKALEDLKQYTAQMDGRTDSSMPKDMGISKNFKIVSMNIVTVLESIQKKSFPSLQNTIAELKQVANKLTTTAIEKQKTTLHAFFRKSNEVLNNMNF